LTRKFVAGFWLVDASERLGACRGIVKHGEHDLEAFAYEHDLDG